MRCSVVLFFATLSSLWLAAAARQVHGSPKPCFFTYTCESTADCATDKLQAWTQQACRGIGGSRLIDETALFSGETETGYSAVCLCCHGNTKDYTYTVPFSSDQCAGTARLETAVPIYDVC